MDIDLDDDEEFEDLDVEGSDDDAGGDLDDELDLSSDEEATLGKRKNPHPPGDSVNKQ